MQKKEIQFICWLRQAVKNKIKIFKSIKHMAMVSAVFVSRMQQWFCFFYHWERKRMHRFFVHFWHGIRHKNGFCSKVRHVGSSMKNLPMVFHGACKLATLVIGIAVVALTAAYLCNTSYVYAVEKDGKVIAYVNDAKAVEHAADIIYEQLEQTSSQLEGQQAIEQKKSVNLQPSIELCAVPNDAPLADDQQLAQRLVDQSKEQVAKLYGVTVDDKLVGAVKNSAPINQALDDIKTDYAKSVGADPATASFVNNVQVKQGVYLADAVSDESKIIATLKGQNGAASPLCVSAISQVQYEQEVPYAEQTIDNPNLAKGFSFIEQEGVNGKVLQTAQVQLVNAQETGRTIVKSDPLMPTVDQITSVGSNTSQGLDYIAINESSPGLHFIRPTAGGYMSQSAANGHNAVDIAGCGGDPIVASETGVVTSARWHDGYGNCVFIDMAME